MCYVLNKLVFKYIISVLQNNDVEVGMKKHNKVCFIENISLNSSSERSNIFLSISYFKCHFHPYTWNGITLHWHL